MAKYSKNFNRDWSFYVSNKDRFNFSGKQPPNIEFNKNGITAKKAFLKYDSYGQLTDTKEPDLLCEVFVAKASVNLHIKMWAEARVEGTLPRPEFENYLTEINAPEWVSDAVERQVKKIYKQRGITWEGVTWH